MFPYLRSYAHAVFGLLLGELPVVVHVVLVYARQVQPGQHSTLSHHNLLLPVHASNDLACLSCVVAAVSNIELDDTCGTKQNRTKEREAVTRNKYGLGFVPGSNREFHDTCGGKVATKREPKSKRQV